MFKGKYLFLSIILISSIFLSNCTRKTTSNPISEVLFTNSDLNFSVEIPHQWSEKYIVEGYENGVNFYSLNNRDYGGLLCSIERLVGELITEEDIKQAPVSQKIILQANGYTYISRLPSDVEYALDNDKLKKEYDEMFEQVDLMTSSIKSLDNSRPKAKIEGYKVIGSSYFTVEIPQEWDIKITEDYALRWEIYSGENIVGDIELLPYKSIYDVLYYETDLNKILLDDEMERKARISINDETNNIEVMQNMLLTFDFIPSHYTILDVQTAAREYLDGGGKKLFGQIEAIDMVDGEPKAITIKVKEFITGASLDTGFTINDLGIEEEYSLEDGVLITPLMPPNYNSFGVYGIYNMDGDFIQSYEYLDDFHYDFIIGSDGKLKIILGFYLP